MFNVVGSFTITSYPSYLFVYSLIILFTFLFWLIEEGKGSTFTQSPSRRISNIKLHFNNIEPSSYPKRFHLIIPCFLIIGSYPLQPTTKSTSKNQRNNYDFGMAIFNQNEK